MSKSEQNDEPTAKPGDDADGHDFDPQADFEESTMSFGDHLEELRLRLFKAIGATLFVFAVVFIFHDDVMRIVTAPYLDKVRELKLDQTLKAKGVTTGFFAYMKVCLIVALIGAMPAWLFQAWKFISAGLYSTERRAVYAVAPFMLLLFFGGVWFGYHILIPIGLGYLLTFPDPDVIQNWIGISEYLSFFAILTLVLGVSFELPVAMAFLGKLELATIETFRTKRRYFILGAFIFGALLTPPDIVTQVLLATPLLFLFELGIFLTWWMQGKDRPPVDWPRWRRRAIKVGLVALVIWLAKGQFSQVYRERQIAGKFATEREGDVRVPRFDLFQSLAAKLGYAPTEAYRLTSTTERELWVVGDDARSDLIELAFTTSRVTRTGETERGAVFLLQPAQSVAAEILETAPAEDVFAILVADLAEAKGEDATRLNGLLAGLVGQKPDDVSSLGDDPSGSDIVAVVKAWRAWRRTNSDWTLIRKSR